ncbi:MAG: LysM peptidoglycan-binding domain-containing protein [Phycisphaerales bacterium]|nr:LysM peptidoglycan-binding domain-containing protein [Phycisphaerales bacterium]
MKLGFLGLMAALAVFLTACAQQDTAPTARADEQPEPLTRMNSVPTEDDPYANDPIVASTPAPAQDYGTSGGTTHAGDRGGRTTAAPAAGDQRTHVIQKGDTLYSLARRYYNDQTRWKSIWEANQGTLRNRDQLPIGTRIVIP